MKKQKSLVLALIAVSAMLAAPQNAFAQAFSAGDKHLHLGIGLLRSYYGSYRAALPPLSISFENGKTDEWGYGGLLAVSTGRDNYTSFGDDYYWRYVTIHVAARGAFHFNILDDEKLDTYVGGLLGLRYTHWTWHSPDGSSTYLYDSPLSIWPTYSVFGGARYQLTDNFRGFAEVGWGISLVTLGVDFKMGGD